MNALNELGVIPAALLPQYDLVIASKKAPFTTSQVDDPILWWKVPGRPQETPPKRCSLADPIIQNKLLDYDLVDTEARQGTIVRRYRRRTQK